MLYPLSYGGPGCRESLAQRLERRTSRTPVAEAATILQDRRVSQRILVVDDTESIRRLIRLNLELEGFDVVEAADGQECLELATALRPDLVTIDVVMPRLDGFAAAAALRADPLTASLPIVMVTTQAQPADRRRGQEIGVDAYVTKPFHPDALVATVRAVLARTPGGQVGADTLDR